MSINPHQSYKGKKMKHSFALFGAVGLLAAAYASPATASNSGVEHALAEQSDVSLFYQALVNTGVARELKENTQYTVFAPTNAAFKTIPPSVYPCFYAAQCRKDIAVVLRNHIVPKNRDLAHFARWGGDVPTIGRGRLDVEEPYVSNYTVEGYRILDQNPINDSYQERGDTVSLYRIDGVIASNQEMAVFRMQPTASASPTVTHKMVTTYRSPVDDDTMPGEATDQTVRTKTITHTTTSE